MINFQLSQKILDQKALIRSVARDAMRPISREYDEREHEKPEDFLKFMWEVSRGSSMTGGETGGGDSNGASQPRGLRAP